MHRAIVVCLALGLLATARNDEGAALGQDRHAALRHDRRHDRTPERGAPAFAAGHRGRAAPGVRATESLGPFVRGLGPADHALNRRRQPGGRSSGWRRASALYGRDPLVAQALPAQLRVDRRLLSRLRRVSTGPGAFVAYAGATRLARRLVLYRLRHRTGTEREVESLRAGVRDAGGSATAGS